MNQLTRKPDIEMIEENILSVKGEFESISDNQMKFQKEFTFAMQAISKTDFSKGY